MSKMRLQLTWYNKDMALIPTETGKYGYRWVDQLIRATVKRIPSYMMSMLRDNRQKKKTDIPILIEPTFLLKTIICLFLASLVMYWKH